MAIPTRPRLRPLEIFPLDESQERFVLRDPAGAAETVVLPLGAALLTALMDGRRAADEIQAAFREQTGQEIAAADVQSLIEQLDARHFLDSDAFRAHWRKHVQDYLDLAVRPAAHAGGAYEGKPAALRKQLARLFTRPEGPGAPRDAPVEANGKDRLCGVLSPHIDLHRGGPAFAWAYKKIVEESDADLFVIFGTAHSAMQNLFSVSRKHFATPLGVVETDAPFVGALAAHYDRLAGEGASQSLFEDEIAHRHEHSIEFQAVFLQYLLGGKRPFKIAPILTGSLHAFFDHASPAAAPRVGAFFDALRAAVADHSGRVCFISGGDLAHIGRRFGDRDLLTAARLGKLREEDHALLSKACAADADGFFAHAAATRNHTRVCGLAPTYAMLHAMRPTRGELLRYDQAVSSTADSCVSFASVAFYRGE
jgi:AmmeMemoRadiSam system protein B